MFWSRNNWSADFQKNTWKYKTNLKIMFWGPWDELNN